MVRDNVTFRITVDGSKASQAFKQLEMDVKKLGGTIDRVNGKTGQLGTGLKSTGQSAAASAVNFQTATQGALNLSTALVQTVTSISNLDRANNRAKMSIIAVARAEDLLANKVERRDSLVRAGEKGSQKYLNITKEIATATADLTVKQEKQRIEQDAVNDIYALFATNIANVTISSIQTITILLGRERTARLASIASTKLHSLVMRGHTTVQVGSNIATKQGIFAMRSMSLATFAQIKATQGLTVATKAMIRANIPLLAATTAISAAFIIYETNAWGAKDAIDGLMGTQNDFEAQVKAMRLAQEEENKALEAFNGLAQIQRGELKKLNPLMANYVNILKSNNVPISVQNQVIADAIRSSGAAGSISSGGDNASLEGGLASNIPGFLLPTILAARGLTNTKTQPKQEFLIGGVGVPGALIGREGQTFKTNTGIIKTKPLNSIQSNLNSLLDNSKLALLQTKDEALISKTIGIGGKFSVFSQVFQNIGTPSQTTRDTFSQEFSLLSPTTKNSILTHLQLQGGTINQVTGELDPFTQDQINLINKELTRLRKERNINTDPVSVFKNIQTNFDETKPGDRLLKLAPSYSTILANKAFRTPLPPALEHLRGKDLGNGIIGPSGFTRNETFYSLAKQIRQQAIDEFDFGTNTRLSGSSLIRIIEQKNQLMSNNPITTPDRYLARTTHRTGQGFRPTDVAAFVRSGAINTFMNNQTLNDPSGLGPDPYGNFADPNFATGASGTRVRVPAWVRQQRAIELENMRRAKYGGIRQKDSSGVFLPFSVQGAVTGGFTSIAAYREDRREQFRTAGHSSRSYLSALGIFVGYSSSPSVNSQKSARAIAQAASIGSLFQRTGFSLSNFGMRKTHRGGGYVQSGAAWDAHRRSVMAANQRSMAMAAQVDILQGGFGLTGFMGGGGFDLPGLQDQVAEQDRLIASIGLNRTEAFRIIDTAGRGRTEIDDRVAWTQRNTSISTGVAVI